MDNLFEALPSEVRSFIFDQCITELNSSISPNIVATADSVKRKCQLLYALQLCMISSKDDELSALHINQSLQLIRDLFDYDSELRKLDFEMRFPIHETYYVCIYVLLFRSLK